MAEITLRAQWAWQFVVSQQVSHRPGFLNLQFADAGDTRGFLKSLQLPDKELFHRCLNGSHITQDGKVYCQEEGSDLCPYCECSDSRFHRFWICPRFAHEREKLPADVISLIPELPDFLTCYGWSIRPHTMLAWYQALDAIQSPQPSPLVPCNDPVHVFTDGTCLNPALPTCRLAAWAVTLAHVDPPMVNQVIDSGPLPGILQSSYRAEIFAVLRALLVLRMQHRPVSIWSDCSAVVKRMNRLLAGAEPKPNSAHADLWCQMFECLKDFPSGHVSITKVAAHRTQNSARTPLEEWSFAHNTFADQAAARAQLDRPAAFWALFDRHVNSTLACHHISRTVQQTLLDISKAVIRDEDCGAEEFRSDLATTPEVPHDAWRPLPSLVIPQAAVRWYGDELVRQIMSWFWMATFQSSSPTLWVSQFQLYIDFMLSGERGPTKFESWQVGRKAPHIDLLAVPFQTRSRWFNKVLKECMRHAGAGLTYAYCRPSSRALFLHTGCLALPWSLDRLEAVDEWILRMIPAGVQRSSKALEGLPIATKDERFDPVWFTTA